MMRALLRTTAVFGTIFAAGYVARRYFGWSPQGLLDAAKHRIGEMGNAGRDSTSSPGISQPSVSRKAI